jgi:hypothetical protein
MDMAVHQVAAHNVAAQTTASPARIWAIIIVAVICLAFWLIMVVGIAPRPGARQRQAREALQVPLAGGMQVPVAGGAHAAAGGRSVAPNRDEPAMEMPTLPLRAVSSQAVPSQAVPQTEAAGKAETRDDLQPVPAPGPDGPSPLDLGGPASEPKPGVQWTARMPAQREPGHDQAVRSRDGDR